MRQAGDFVLYSVSIMGNTRKTTSAVMWGGLDLVLRQGVVFALSVVLARLLSPDDFGVIAMLSLFTGIASVLAEGGFGAALIQRPTLTTAELSSVFYFNIAAGLVIACVMVVAAPWISAFYRMPILEPLTWVMALNLFLGTFRTVQVALLTKALNFRVQMKVTLATSLVSGALGAFLAWRGWGVWSLAVQAVASTALSGICLWLLSPWRPGWCFEASALRSLAGYGSYMAFAGLLDTAYTRLNTLVIGRWYSANDLGLYARADGIQQIPASSISGLLGRVAFPVFSAAAAVDREALRQAGRRALAGVMLINTPAMIGIAATSHSLVQTVFGDRWLPCVPILQVLCISGIFWPLHVVNLNLVKSCGRSDLFFRLEVIKKVIGLAVLAVTASLGVVPMAWGQVLVGFICYLVNASYSGILARYPIRDQLRDMVPYVLVSAIMGIGVVTLSSWERPPAALRFVAQVTMGIALYGGFCAALKLPAYLDVRRRCLELIRLPRTTVGCA